MQVRFILPFATLLIIIYSFSCSNTNVTSQKVANGDTSRIPPVETKKPNSNYSPAFSGQTRIGGAKTTTAYKVDLIADKLGRPWAIVPMNDGRLMITEKTGFMEIHNAD